MVSVRVARLGERAIGLDRTLLFVVGPLERRGAEAAGAPATLEREEDVGAVREAGRFAGRVGDFGRGLTKALAGDCVAFFAAWLAVDDVADGRPFSFEEFAVDVGGLVVFSAAGFVVAAFVAADVLDEFDLTEWPGVTGVFGSAGDFVGFEDDAVVADDLLVEIGAGFALDLFDVTLPLEFEGSAVLSFPVFTPFKPSPTLELPLSASPPETAAELVISAGKSFVFGSSTVVGLSGLAVELPPAGFASAELVCCPSCLLVSMSGVSMANSGTISETARLSLLAWNSSAIECFLSWISS